MDGVFNISINYPKTIAQANKLSKIAGDCRDIQRDALKEKRFIESNWKGKTGDSLSAKLGLLEKNCTKAADSLEQVSRTMKRVAEEIRQADLASIARIQAFDK